MAAGNDPKALARQMAANLTREDLTTIYETLTGPARNFKTWRVAYPADKPLLWIFRDDLPDYGPSLGATQGATLDHIYQALEQMPSEKREGIRVPEVYRVMEDDRFSYLIMEVVQGPTLRDLMSVDLVTDKHLDDVARALRLLLLIPAPEGTGPGPLPFGCIVNDLFDGGVSPGYYESVQQLEDDMNAHLDHENKERKTWKQAPARSLPHVKLERELHLVYGDIQLDSFVIADAGDLCLTRFDMAGYLPLSFMPFAVHCSLCPWLAEGLSTRLCADIPKDNLGAMLYLKENPVGVVDETPLKPDSA